MSLLVIVLAIAAPAVSAVGAAGACCEGMTVGMKPGSLPCHWVMATACCDDTAATSSPPAAATSPLLTTGQALVLRPNARLERCASAPAVVAVPHALLSTIVLLL